ncbi:MAG: hypothetical protein LM558_04435 [Thermosphaera sp.]|jgi:hypothetical protein|nr:hypothetical protein [Thermosphaera sp.]
MEEECKICGKKIAATTRKQLEYLLVQHMLTHERFFQRVLRLIEEGDY